MSTDVFVFLRPFLNALLIGVGGAVVAFILYKLVRLVLVLPLGPVWSRFIGSLVALVVAVWTVKLILDSTGAAGLLVVIVTAITGAFAIGSERVAGDLLAGIGIFLGRSYSVGDFVVIAGQEGRISNISLLTTTLENANGDEIYIRNGDASGGTIINYSAHPGHLISVKVPLPIDQDLSRAVQAVQTAVDNFSPELSDKPMVVVEAADEGYFIIEVRAYMTERLDSGPEKTRLFLLAVNAIKDAGLRLSRD